MSARPALAALIFLAATAALAEQGAMKVAFAEGDAQVGRGETLAPLEAGMELEPLYRIHTGDDGRCEIALASGSVLRIGPKSMVELGEAADADKGSFRAKLTFGNLWARVMKLMGGQRFEIETQNAVAGVRGTEFHVTSDDKGRAAVRVYEGAVEVKGASFTHVLQPGRELRYGAKAVIGPREFDRKRERGFMRWVRERDRRRDDGPRHERRKRDGDRDRDKDRDRDGRRDRR